MKPATVQKILKRAEKARDAWIAEHISDRAIEITVQRRLNEILDKTLYTFLGLSESFGELRVDHCNGRKSILSKKVENLIDKLLPSLLEKHLQDLEARPLTQKMRKALQDEYDELIHRKLYAAISKKAEVDAEALIQEFVNKEAAEAIASIENELGGQDLAHQNDT